jgi:hypothetical protein
MRRVTCLPETGTWGAKGPCGGAGPVSSSSCPHSSSCGETSTSKPFSSEGGVAHTAVVRSEAGNRLELVSHSANSARLQSQLSGLSVQTESNFRMFNHTFFQLSYHKIITTITVICMDTRENTILMKQHLLIYINMANIHNMLQGYAEIILDIIHYFKYI